MPIFYDGSYDQIIFEGKPIDFRKIAKDRIPFIYGSSLSKDFNYPGARIGWVAFHGDKWSEVKNAFFLLCNQRLSVNWEYQKAAAAAIADPSYPAYVADLKKKLIERRDTFVKITRDMPLSFPVPERRVLCIHKDRNSEMEERPGIRACRTKGRSSICPRFRVRKTGGRSVFQNHVLARAAHNRRGIRQNQTDFVNHCRSLHRNNLSVCRPKHCRHLNIILS